MSSRQDAIARVTQYFDSGEFATELARRVGLKTESRNPARAADIDAYLNDEIGPYLQDLGFTVSGFWAAFFGGLVVGLVSMVLSLALMPKEARVEGSGSPTERRRFCP